MNLPQSAHMGHCVSVREEQWDSRLIDTCVMDWPSSFTASHGFSPKNTDSRIFFFPADLPGFYTELSAEVSVSLLSLLLKL